MEQLLDAIMSMYISMKIRAMQAEQRLQQVEKEYKLCKEKKNDVPKKNDNKKRPV